MPMIKLNIVELCQTSMRPVDRALSFREKFWCSIVDDQLTSNLPFLRLYIPALTDRGLVINATQLGLNILALTWQRDMCSRFDEELRCPEP